MFFEREMKFRVGLSDDSAGIYDCDGCLWPGFEVSQGDYETARASFDAHQCDDYIQCND